MMPENVNDKKVFSLFEVTNSIQKTLAERYKSAYWIKAEMSKLNFYNHSGHCYPELIEKKGGKVVAQVKANLWKDDYRIINHNFLNLLKEPLKDGIKILFLAYISFEPIYGLALRIVDIDPGYTLGDLEKEKQDTIKRMQTEGVFDRNKKLQIPVLPQRIAIISVETSKGYADFLKVLETNSWGYHFFHLLFPSLLQGDKAIDSIIKQLKRIKKVKTHFDVVAIIRGGGGDVGLSCYNNYTLAREIALFPIPVITGIGHATNETVVEMISFANEITPSKIAEYLLQKFHNFSVPVRTAEEKIIDRSKRIIGEEKTRFNSGIKLFRSVTENVLLENKSRVKERTRSLFQQSLFRCRNEKYLVQNIREDIKKGAFTFCGSGKQEIRQLALDVKKDVIYQLTQARIIIAQHAQLVVYSSGTIFMAKNQVLFQTQQSLTDKAMKYLNNKLSELKTVENNIDNMSPQNVLKRGYSITYSKGKIIKSLDDIKVGDTIDTIIFDGNIESIVKSLEKIHEK